MKRFICVRQGEKNDRKFPNVVICDTWATVPAIINDYPTRVYKPVSEVMHYLEAYPKMVELNKSSEPITHASNLCTL